MEYRRLYIFLTAILFLNMVGLSDLSAQDSIMPQNTVQSNALEIGEKVLPAEATAKEIVLTPPKRSSTKALLFSIIPGGGQIYNRQYWKLPIIVSAYTACYYAISWNNSNLVEYANAYRDIKSSKPLENTSWQNFIPFGANPESYVNNSTFHDTLRRGRDFFRRYRDLSIIIAAGVYILVMVDAYVDAELSNFDISPNLTISYTPTYITPTLGHDLRNGGIGMQLALTF